MGKGALAFIAGLGTGYLNQRNREEEKARQDKFDQIALDRAADEKSERDRKKKILADVASAAQDGSAVEIQDKSIQPQQSVIGANGIAGAGGSQNQDATSATPIAAQGIPKSTWQVGGKSFSDADSANKAAQEYNAPEARNSRIAQAYRANGDHITALDIEGKASRIKGDAIRTEADQLNLNQAKEQEARLAFGRGMVNAYSSGGGAGLMSFLSDSHADGESGAVKFEQQLSPDGKIATVFKINSKGEKLKVGDVPNTDEGWQSAMFKLQRGLDPNALFAHSAALKKQELEERKVAATERKADADARRADASERKTDALISGVIGARGINGKQKEDTPIWDAGADKTLVGLFTRKDELGNETIDSSGVLFAKKIGMALASQNGGDSFSAAHKAVTIDNQLRAKAGGDPKKLEEFRAEYIRRGSGAPVQQQITSDTPASKVTSSGGAPNEISTAKRTQLQPPPTSQTAPVKASEYKGVSSVDRMKQGFRTVGEAIGSGLDFVARKDRELAYERKLNEVRRRITDGLDLNPEQRKLAIESGLMIDDLKAAK